MNVNVYGHTVHVETVGAGRALVTVHGGPGLDHTWFRPYLDPLGDRAKLVYYDQANCGQSARDVPLAGGFDTWVAELEGLRSVLGFDTMVLLGHSAGSYLALAYALKHAKRIAGLVLVASAPKLDFAAASVAMATRLYGQDMVRDWVEAVSAPVREDEDYRRSWMRVLPMYSRTWNEPRAREHDARARYSAAALNYGFGAAFPSYDVTPRLGDIDAPTLLITGAHDWVTPVEHGARRLAAKLPRAQLEVFDGSGHFPFIEEPDRFVQLVSGWLDRLPR